MLATRMRVNRRLCLRWRVRIRSRKIQCPRMPTELLSVRRKTGPDNNFQNDRLESELVPAGIDNLANEFRGQLQMNLHGFDLTIRNKFDEKRQNRTMLRDILVKHLGRNLECDCLVLYDERQLRKEALKRQFGIDFDNGEVGLVD